MSSCTAAMQTHALALAIIPVQAIYLPSWTPSLAFAAPEDIGRP